MSKDDKKPEAKQDDKKAPVGDERIAQLEAEKAELEKKLAALVGVAAVHESEPHFTNAKGQRVPERFKGKKTYRLGAPHYREGVYMPAGELITVTDETPSRTWSEVNKDAAPTPEATPKPSARGSATMPTVRPATSSVGSRLVSPR